MVPAVKDLPISIRFLHSVQKTPVLEELAARKDGSGFVLLATKYQSFGVGLPFLETEGVFHQEGDFYVFNHMNRSFPSLSLRTGVGTQLTVCAGGRVFRFYEQFPPGTKIDLLTMPFYKGMADVFQEGEHAYERKNRPGFGAGSAEKIRQ